MNTNSRELHASAAVTSPHHLATLEGKRILEEGGNAIEAALVMGACLSVLYPHFTGLGGDTFLLIADAEGNSTSLSGIGQCSQQLPDFNSGIPTRGGGSCLTTAATIDALGTALELSANQYGGSLSWNQILEPAIILADRGFPLSRSQNYWMSFRECEIGTAKGCVSNIWTTWFDTMKVKR
jgi:gamma-glutamyltranspeptidase